MSRLSSFVFRFASLKVTCVLMVAFLLLIFWGVLGQAAAGNDGAALATDRFFNSYFLWVLGIIPLPAFKTLAIIASLHLVASMACRMPKVRGVPGGWRNLGLYGMHFALLVLLVGSLVGSELREEYNGFSASAQKVTFFAVDDSLNVKSVKVGDGYPYFVFYKGQVDMMGTKVDLYTATYDPLKFVPYAFMILFLASMVFHYIARVRCPKCASAESGKKISGAASVILLVMVGVLTVPSHSTEEDAILWIATAPEDPVLVGNDIRAFDSFARGVLNDFCGRTSYSFRKEDHSKEKLSATWVVEEILHAPKFTDKYTLFKVLRNDVIEALDLPSKERYVSYEMLQRNRGKLEVYASRKDEHPATLEMQRLLQNVQLYEAIARGEEPRFISYEYAKENGIEIDYSRLKVEAFYNHANFALIAFILAFLGCGLAAVNSIFKKRGLDVCANLVSGATAAVLVIAFVLRFYIAARPPLSSLYEIVLLVALLLEAFEFGAFLLCKKRTFALMVPVTAVAAVLLFFAKFILEPGDLFQSIPAVLNSSIFLTMHVFSIALGFSGVILSGIVAHLYLFRLRKTSNAELQASRTDSRISNLSPLLYGTLVFGSGFTILGTLLGGVWADYAWGRFWGFDPKECGALFVCLWTMLALHLRRAGLVGERGFALFNSFNVIVTFLCWFGINLLGIGLHSYGFQDGTALWLAGFVAIDTATICLIVRGVRC